MERDFNGATAMKPWKSTAGTVEIGRPAHFNGATAMKPWKSPRAATSRAGVNQLQWGHGDEAVEEEEVP